MNISNAKIIIADSENDSDMFYATKFIAPDTFTFIQKNKKKIIVVNDLELDRAKIESNADTVLAYSKYEKITKKKKHRSPSFIEVIETVLREMNIGNLLVPANFSLFYADFLRKKGFNLRIKKNPFFNSREIKKEIEINCIIKTQRGVEKSLHKAIDYIKKSKIKNGLLYSSSGIKITSEFMRKMVNIELLKNGFIAKHTIVSCSEQSSVPHNIGEGDLKANEPIVFDIFPKDEKTGYYADMSRTIVKGKASIQLKKMFNAIISAQNIVFEYAKDGIDGSFLHRKVVNHLKKLGFKTGKHNGRMEGFFHGTGHGVGLDVHELPKISQVKHILKSGNVVTVEPGLYYKTIGGVRIEDMILITDDSCVNLTKFPKVLEV